jgi:MOSC domain-containing protein YiiM
MSGRVVSVRAGRARVMARPAWDHRAEREYTSAYIKDEVPGPVMVGPLGLDGDEQVDKANHGGPHMAVLAYGAGHYPRWREELGIEGFGHGAFGENLAVDGDDETSVCVGDRFAAGGVVVEVASPRGPCADISRRWDREDLLRRVTETGRTGWYLRVIQPGRIAVGDAVTRVAQPHPQWPVGRVFHYYTRQARDAEGLRALIALEVLSPTWREAFERRLAHPDE